MSRPVAKPSPRKAAAPQHASGDKRFKLLEATMKRHQYRPEALIEVLHSAQELFGYLEEDLLYFVARSLKVPPSRVYGVATFYHFFSLKPKGKHTCIICLGTACYVKGAGELAKVVEESANVKTGATTSDGNLTLLPARCLGACGIAPAVVLDGTVAGNQTTEDMRQFVERCMHG